MQGKVYLPGQTTLHPDTIKDAIKTRKKIICITKNESIHISDQEDAIDDLLIELIKNKQVR